MNGVAMPYDEPKESAFSDASFYKNSLKLDKEYYQKFPPEFIAKLNATNEADEVFLRDSVNYRDTSASKAAYLKAKKEERDLLTTLVKAAPAEEARKLAENYEILMRWRGRVALIRSPEFGKYFEYYHEFQQAYFDTLMADYNFTEEIQKMAAEKDKSAPKDDEKQRAQQKYKYKKTKKRFGSKKRISNLRGNRNLESEFKDMKKRRNSLEEKLKKRSKHLKRQEKGTKKRGRKVFDLEENMEDKDFMDRFVEDRQDMEIVDRVERNIDKGSAEINHRKAIPDDKGDNSSSSCCCRSSGGRGRAVFWFSIVVGIIAETVVIIVVLLAYRNDIFRRRQMRRSTRELAEPLNPDRRHSSKILSATTLSPSMMH